FYKRKLVSNIYSYPMDLRDGGLFIIGATCNEGVDPKQVVEEIREFIRSYTPTPKELDKARYNTKYDFLRSFESSEGTGSLFGGYLAKGSLKPLLEYYQSVEELDGEGILAVKKYFNKGITLTLYRS
ncbi:MAG: insulinase family protein, partial [Campylobacterales bacterium]